MNPYKLAINDPEFQKKLLDIIKYLSNRIESLEKAKPQAIDLSQMFNKIVGELKSENYNFKALSDTANIYEFHGEFEKLLKKFDILMLEGSYHK